MARIKIFHYVASLCHQRWETCLFSMKEIENSWHGGHGGLPEFWSLNFIPDQIWFYHCCIIIIIYNSASWEMMGAVPREKVPQSIWDNFIECCPAIIVTVTSTLLPTLSCRARGWESLLGRVYFASIKSPLRACSVLSRYYGERPLEVLH